MIYQESMIVPSYVYAKAGRGCQSNESDHGSAWSRADHDEAPDGSRTTAKPERFGESGRTRYAPLRRELNRDEPSGYHVA